MPGFSLVLGGPLFQLFRRARLSGDTLELVLRRVLVISCVAWVPLLLLSAAAGQGDAIAIPFRHDIEAHVRFLIALPILVVAELVVHRRLRPVVAQFQGERIVAPEDMPAFHEAIDSAMRVRNAAVAEAAILVAVYTLGVWGSQQQIVALGTASWYAMTSAGRMHLTPAGYWYIFVSIPLFQFILVRWYFRFFLWFWFLWRVSRLSLRLRPIHPDRTAGLGFLGTSLNAFLPILFAQNALLAGMIASLVVFAGRDVLAFKLEVAAFLALFVAIVLSPLTVFVPHLVRAKRRGSSYLDHLAGRYVEDFEEKWVVGRASEAEPILGSADIQSLADLGSSYDVVQEMRLVPFGWRDVTKLALGGALPFLPLALTVLSLEDLLSRLMKVLL